jgi:SAM-dependent methyltransferase
MNCDGIARWYRFLEHLVFGRALERRRLEFMEAVADARSVLILGDGDGRFTAEFVRRNPVAVVESIDMSGRMVELAKRRVTAHARVQCRVGDARTAELAGRYDLIVTHFFLDCLADAELAGLAARIAASCQPGARWLVSEFALPSAGLARLAAQALIRVMYFCFRVATGLRVTRLPNYAQALPAHGFRRATQREAAGGLLVSEVWELFRP